MYRDTIFQYVKKQYGTIPEYLWNDLPDSAILRNDNGKWYAVFMNLEGFKIGLDTKDRVDIMVVKCKPDMISVMTHMKGFLPGYYMDKSNWMTICIWRILTAGFAEQNGRNAKLNGRITFDY